MGGLGTLFKGTLKESRGSINGNICKEIYEGKGVDLKESLLRGSKGGKPSFNVQWGDFDETIPIGTG